MKNLINILITSSVILILNSCGTKNPAEGKDKEAHTSELKGSISISGAFALYPMAVTWADEFKKLNPGVKIDVSAGGAGKGMMDALSGMIDLGMVSRSVSPEEEAKGAWKIAVTKDAVLPTVNIKNPLIKDILTKGLTKEKFIDIFITNKIKTWGEALGSKDKSKINAYTRSDACGAAEMWGKYLGKNQEALKGVGVFGDPGIADAVKRDNLGIGFNNVIYAYDIKSRNKYDGMEVIPIDINGNGKIDADENFYENLDKIMQAIQQGKYPSPPARDLYFVSKGKPVKPEVVAFLKWILTDGQKFVNGGGYVCLTNDKIAAEADRLK